MHLHKYQERMVQHILDNPRCALWAEMGLGKTAATLHAINELYQYCEVGRILVLAPPRVMQKVWPDEMKKWGIDIPYSVLTGSPKEKYAILNQDAHLTFCSIYNLDWLTERKELDAFDIIVIDEAHFMKSPKSNRYKRFKANSAEVERIVELTGTPAGNGLLDVWAQLSILDDGERLGHPFSYFRDRYFESDWNGYNWSLREGSKEAIYEAVSDICISLAATDYLDMPDIITNDVKFSLTPKSRRFYKELEKEFLLQLEDADIVADSAAALTQKLQQAAAGAVYDEDRLVHELHAERSDALASVIADNVGEPILVTYTHKFQIPHIMKVCPKAQMVATNTVDLWNAGEIPVLICHPSNLGLNLQQGGHILVWYGLTWSLTDYQQIVARLWRQGQEKPVIVHRIICVDTVDEVIVKAIDNKELGQRELLDAVRMQANEV